MTTTMRDTATSADIHSALSHRTWSVEALIDEARTVAFASRPFAEDRVAFCEALSAELLSAGAGPEVVSLGYWLRPASLARARQRFMRDDSEHLRRVPRGLAFHVTPANVDTMFAYSWLISLLAGNSNLVRLSSRSTATRSHLLESIGRILAQPRFAELEHGNRLVFSDHDERISRALSAAADVRVVWGGDATVERFRQYSLPVRAREIVFPDRHSLALLDSDAVLAADQRTLNRLGEAFFNDAFWFDQAACSSPRLIVWRHGDGASATLRARERFHDAVLAAIRRRGYRSETGTAINKMVRALEHAAIEEGVRIDTPANEVSWVEVRQLDHYDRRTCGGGLFFEYESSDLAADLMALAGPSDQTATCFGLDKATLLALAGSLNGRGIDRFVNVGHALEFGTEWDGLDLLSEFSKRVVIDVS